MILNNLPKLIAVGAGIIAIGFVLSRVFIHFYNKAIMQRIQSEFGAIPDNEWSDDDFNSMKRYFNLKKDNTLMDDITWNDLDMDHVFHRINTTQSSIGDEALYHHLHTQHQTDLQTFEAQVQLFTNNEALRLSVQKACYQIGRMPNNGLIEFIEQGDNVKPLNTHQFKIQALLAFAALILILFKFELGLIATTCMLIVNFMTLHAKMSSIDKELTIFNMMVKMLKSNRDIIKSPGADTLYHSEALKTCYQKLSSIQKISSYLSVSSATTSKTMEISFFYNVILAYFLLPFFAYNRIIKLVSKHHAILSSLYQIIGDLEISIATASYRQSIDEYCHPIQTQTKGIQMVNVVHPLVQNPVSNSLNMENHALITGSNASGKSTFVKAVTLNVLLGQTLNTCLATRFVYQPSFIITSMAIRDDIKGGDSYFVAETKSIKRILDHDKNKHCLIIIDEILKGTNTIERIAASAALLNYLKDSKSFICAATHDIELTKIHQNHYTNYHFKETVTNNAITFDYIINEGPSNTRNAIKLLEFLDYPPRIVSEANQLADNFTSQKKWEAL